MTFQRRARPPVVRLVTDDDLRELGFVGEVTDRHWEYRGERKLKTQVFVSRCAGGVFLMSFTETTGQVWKERWREWSLGQGWFETTEQVREFLESHRVAEDGGVETAGPEVAAAGDFGSGAGQGPAAVD